MQTTADCLYAEYWQLCKQSRDGIFWNSLRYFPRTKFNSYYDQFPHIQSVIKERILLHGAESFLRG